MSNRRALATKDVRVLRLRQRPRRYVGFPRPVYNYVCKNCYEISFDHARGKCLFGATAFQASAPFDEYDLWAFDKVAQLLEIPRHQRVSLKQRKRFR